MDKVIPVLFAAGVFSWLIESFVEYFIGRPLNSKPEYKVALPYIALLLGLGVAFLLNLDLVYVTVNEIFPGSIVSSPVTLFASGTIVGRGSEWVHMFVSKFLGNKVPGG